MKASCEAISKSYDLDCFRCELGSPVGVSRELRLKGSAERLHGIARRERIRGQSHNGENCLCVISLIPGNLNHVLTGQNLTYGETGNRKSGSDLY